MKRFISFFLVLICLASCQKAPVLSLTGLTNIELGPDGGSDSITFIANRDWAVSWADSWISVSPSSGTGSKNPIIINVSSKANSDYDDRSGKVTITMEGLTQTVTVKQLAKLGLLVSSNTIDITNAAQSITIDVQQNVNYTVEIDEACKDWIKQSNTKALSTDKVMFNISANTNYDSREGKISFIQTNGGLSQTVTIRQSQTNGLFITTADYNLSNGAHTLSVEVKANVDFDVTTQADWIKYVETKSLTPSTIVLNIAANDSYDNRTGTVKVKQRNGDLTGTITITQMQADFLSVTPTSLELSNNAQQASIEVKNNIAFNVVIPDDAKSWISVSSNTQTKAMTDDTVIFSIAKNETFDVREASVTIKQIDGPLAETVVIKQAFSEGLLVEKLEYEVSYTSSTIEIDARSNVELQVTPQEGWIHYVETKALSNRLVILSIDPNESYEQRVGTVIIKTKSGIAEHAIHIYQAAKYMVEAVDMGLSVKWSNQNIGATKPEDYGDYYAWGEIETKDLYTWENYKWCKGSSISLTKYCVDNNYGEVDNLVTLEKEDDVAAQIWQGEWRIPTSSEWAELRENCDWSWTTKNGVNGYLVTSTLTGASIFLPATGSWQSKLYEGGEHGWYWSSSLLKGNSSGALGNHFVSYGIEESKPIRSMGLAIRPVK